MTRRSALSDPRTHHFTAEHVRNTARDLDRVVHRRMAGGGRQHRSSELITLALSEHPHIESLQVFHDERGTVRLDHTLSSGEVATTTLEPDDNVVLSGRLVIGLTGGSEDIVTPVGDVHPTQVLEHTAAVLRRAAHLVTRYAAGVQVQPQL